MVHVGTQLLELADEEKSNPVAQVAHILVEKQYAQLETLQGMLLGTHCVNAVLANPTADPPFTPTNPNASEYPSLHC